MTQPQPIAPGRREPDGSARSVLVAASDARTRFALLDELRLRGVRAVEARDAPEALHCLAQESIDLVVCEEGLGPESGVALLAVARERYPGVGRVLLSSQESASRIRDAVNRAGVGYFLPVGWDSDSFDAALRSANPESADAVPEASTVGSRRFPGIIGQSPAIAELLDLVSLVGPTNSTVLISGETGSGKELIGRAVHEASARSGRTFSGVNSAAFPETLLESELFGHTRGSFTGASSNKKGLFEQADKGTVFLDEVAEMPLSMQAKLLRFLQTGEIRPIGSESTRFVDVRLVAATNKDLIQEVERGTFREDLYYRLAVIPLHVPALRERAADIPLLARHFLARLSERSGQPLPVLESEALDALLAHDWPGNVRELENVMERAIALSRNGRIGREVLPQLTRTRRLPAAEGPVESLPVLERRHIIETLDRVGWNRKRAAELLEISTTTLWRRLKEFGVDGHPARIRFDTPGAATGGPGRR